MYNLSHIGKIEILDAIGEDSIKIVKGNRRSVKIFGIKESLKIEENQEKNEEKSTEFSRKDERTGSLLQIPCFYWIESGGCGDDQFKVKKSYKQYITRKNQTNEEIDYVYSTINPEDEGFENILYGNPSRSIQPEEYIYLKDFLQPGWKSTKNEEDETSYFQAPDLYPISTAIDSVVDEKEHKPPRIKLNDWKPQKLRDLERKRKSERDNEWLQYNPKNEDDQSNQNHSGFNSTSELDPYCKDFFVKLRMLHFVMKWTGRWPFIGIVKSNIIQHEVKSRSSSYIVFMITSFLHSFITMILLFNTWIFINAEHESNNIRYQIALLEFDKYWHFVFWTYLSALFVFLWNVLFLSQYIHIFQCFLNRWSLAISILRYDPKLLVPSKIIYYWTLGFILYGLVFSFGTFTTVIPAIRGFTGVIGSMFLKDFKSLRFSRYFFLLRFFGLIFHLYTIWCCKATMLLLVVYAKILENSYKNWILRFAIRFDLLKKRYPTKDFGFSKFENIQLNVAFGKLLSELKTILSFARYTRVIFNVLLSLFMLFRGSEIVLFIYRSLYYISSEVKKKDSTDIPIGKSGDKIVYLDSVAQQLLSCFCALFVVLLGWFVTCLNVSSFGETILSGLSIIRRHNLIFCKNSEERRFIQSIYAQFTSVSEYFPKATVAFNRRLVFRFFVWIALFAIGLLSLTPFLLHKGKIVVCNPPNENGDVICDSYAVGRATNPPPPLKPTTIPSTTKSTKDSSSSCEPIPSWTIRDKYGSLVFKTTPVKPGLPKACTRRPLRDYRRYEHNVCIKTGNPATSPFPYQNLPVDGLVQCGKYHTQYSLIDDCGNLAIKAQPKIEFRLLHMIISQNKSEDSKKCVECFVEGDGRSRASLDYCHMLSSYHAYTRCGGGTNLLKHASGEDYNIKDVICNPNFENFIECRTDEWGKAHHVHDVISFFAKSSTSKQEERLYAFVQGVREVKFSKCWVPHSLNSHPFQWATIEPVSLNLTGHRKPILKSYYDANTTKSIFLDANLNPSSVLHEQDDCNNFPFADAMTKLAVVLEIDNNGKPHKVVCCWHYVKDERQSFYYSVQTCHMQSKDQALTQCKQPFKWEFKDRYEANDCATKLNKNNCDPNTIC